MRSKLPFLAVSLAATAGSAVAAIERLDLKQMVAKSEGAVVGEIRDVYVTAHELPDAGLLLFTHLRIVGMDLYAGAPADVTVSFVGGELAGVAKYSSEQPTAAEARLGNRVVAFYKYEETMGGIGGGGMNALYAAHGGIFSVLSGPKGEVVLGKGEGYAVETNVLLEPFRAQAAALRPPK
jgi:hypothetical protein